MRDWQPEDPTGVRDPSDIVEEENCNTIILPAGSAHEASECLVHFLQPRHEVGAAKGLGFAVDAGKGGLAGALEGVDLWQGRAGD